MFKITHQCGDCGWIDTNLDRFEKHLPCFPEAKTVWIEWNAGTSTGKAGRRARNDPAVIAGVVKELWQLYPGIGIEVHHGNCNDGRTTPNPCDCYPQEVIQ